VPESNDAPRLLLAWEALPARSQVLVAFPLLFALLLILHLTILSQPLGRGLAYAVFWSALATGAVVAATRNEAAARRRRQAAGDDDVTSDGG
jgi:hypothetical protein